MRALFFALVACSRETPAPLSNRAVVRDERALWWQDECRHAGGEPRCQPIPFVPRTACRCER